ncbi:adenine deaminase [Phaeodactylibacter xiamenensis]|uniref:adenine deaminase n=1 Tax=Phaeodactylibacter xiamenensis TaxID=1524460 RepID=UPI0024A7ED7A|nr:adenine deaminase [Phaeodactylibacter xiamenensis]
MQQREGQLVDLHLRKIYPARITWASGRILDIEPLQQAEGPYFIPGFIDAHVHIESSMVVPSEFARLAVQHGTIGTVSDPHEIANVLGIPGVLFMIKNGQQVPFHFAFGAPSCVPATTFETAGAEIDVDGIRQLLAMPEVSYLAEMMNYPGVLHKEEGVMAKIAEAHAAGKPVDGHAPGLKGQEAQQYAAAGISTDHECFTLEEARYKAKLGMKILIREGSAARNFDALIPLIREYPGQIMFCSDDKHPDSLLEGHINLLVAEAVARGYDFYDVLRAACVHPVAHYGMAAGLLRPGESADFIMVEDLRHFKVLETWIKGSCVYREGQSLIERVSVETPNQFNRQPLSASAFQIKAESGQLHVIEAIDGSLITGQTTLPPLVSSGLAVSDPGRDLLKLTVINRYQEAAPQVGFIRGFGLKQGAIASCVGHDSHNIIAVGTNDEQLTRAVNLVIANKGGVSAVGAETEQVLPLPVAGIMSNEDGFEVASAYQAIDRFVRMELGSPLRAPFMTLSFMALLVIPDLKLSDKGLFSGQQFEFIPLFKS